MYPHEIIEEIRKDCPVNLLTKLKTSPIFMEQLREYYSESHDGARCWYMIDLIDNLLLCKLSFGQFIAADKDGKPLPVLYKYTLTPAFIKEHNIKDTFKYKSDYNEAQQGVIFEGWEVVNSISIKHTTTGDTLQFFKNGNIYYDRRVRKEEYEGFFLGTNPPIADLAAATTENPLKLK